MAQRLGLIVLSVTLLIAVIVAGAVGWVAWFPDTLKPPLERLLTAQLGRQVRIDGPLRVQPGRVTTVQVEGLHIAAPDWARADDLVAIDRLRLGADLWAYLRHGTVSITELIVDRPRVALERDQQRRTSWPSGGGGAEGGSGEMPKVSLGRVDVTDGRIDLVDAVGQVELAANVATAGSQDGGIGLRLDGNGQVRGDPLQVAVHVGALREVAERGAPIPVDGTLTVADTHVTLKGDIEDAASLAGVNLGVSVDSQNPSALLALAGRAVDGPAPPPLAASARLTGGGQRFALEDLRARWGGSGLDGQLRLDLSPAKPRLDGKVTSQLLDLETLLPLVKGADDSAAAAPPASANPVRALADYEGRLELAAAEIRLPSQLVLRDAAVTLELADERLRAGQLRVGLPEGTLEGELSAGPLNAPALNVDAQLRAAGLGIAALAGDGYGGTVDGRLEGTLALGSIQELLARSRLRFEGRGDGLELPQAKLGSIDVTAVLADGRLTLEPLQANLPQGEVAGRVVAGPFDENFTADLDLDARGVDLAAIARVEGVGGRLDGHLGGQVRGAQPLDVLTRSHLELKGTIDDLRLPQVERGITRASLVLTLDPDRREALKLTADARAGDRPLKVTAFGGSFGTLAENRGDYPFTVLADLGKNEVEVNGTVSMPLTERTFAATVRARGPDPSPILALFQLPKLQIPPYRLNGVLTNRGQELEIKDFAGKVGDSDVAADLTVSFAGERPKVAGRVSSKVLDVDDLGGLVGATPATGPGETASPGQQAEVQQREAKTDVLPDEPVDPSRWRKVDLDLALNAEEVRAGKVPLDSFTGDLSMADGRLQLERLDLRIGEGHLTGRVEADGRRAPVRSEVELELRRVSVARLMNRLDVDVATFGTLSGQARGGVGVGGEGFSIKGMLANSNGEIQLLMEGGQVNRTIVAGLGLDLLRLLGAATGATPEMVELRCVLADLDIGDGVVRTDPLVIDTEIADLGGQGTIDLGTETIDVSLTARPKETPLLTELTGISIGGKLGAPELNINPVAVAARGVAAATLGIVLKPFTALAGAAEDQKPSACADMLRQQDAAEGG